MTCLVSKLEQQSVNAGIQGTERRLCLCGVLAVGYFPLQKSLHDQIPNLLVDFKSSLDYL